MPIPASQTGQVVPLSILHAAKKEKKKSPQLCRTETDGIHLADKRSLTAPRLVAHLTAQKFRYICFFPLLPINRIGPPPCNLNLALRRVVTVHRILQQKGETKKKKGHKIIIPNPTNFGREYSWPRHKSKLATPKKSPSLERFFREWPKGGKLFVRTRKIEKKSASLFQRDPFLHFTNNSFHLFFSDPISKAARLSTSPTSSTPPFTAQAFGRRC